MIDIILFFYYFLFIGNYIFIKCKESISKAKINIDKKLTNNIIKIKKIKINVQDD